MKIKAEINFLFVGPHVPICEKDVENHVKRIQRAIEAFTEIVEAFGVETEYDLKVDEE